MGIKLVAENWTRPSRRAGRAPEAVVVVWLDCGGCAGAAFAVLAAGEIAPTAGVGRVLECGDEVFDAVEEESQQSLERSLRSQEGRRAWIRLAVVELIRRCFGLTIGAGSEAFSEVDEWHAVVPD